MIELSSFDIGVPVLGLTTRVHHAARRRPTAFERMLLRSPMQFGDDPLYGDLTLEDVFADILSVTDPEPLVLPALRALINLDLLRSRVDVSSIANVKLSDLTVTERGETMFRDNMLPAAPMEDVVEHFYDPVAQALLPQREDLDLDEEEPEICLDAEEFTDEFPYQAIEAALKSGRYRWLQAGSEIERLEREAVSVRWRHQVVRLAVEQGTISVVCERPEYASHLTAMPSRDLYKRIVSKVLGTAQEVARNLPVIDAENMHASGGRWRPLAALAEIEADETTWLINRQADVAPIPSQATARQAILVFTGEQDADSPRVEWNEQGNGAIVVIGKPFPLQGFCATDQALWSACRVRLRIGRDNYEIPLLHQDDTDQATIEIRRVLDDVANSLFTSEEDAVALAAARLVDGETFWTRMVERLAHPAKPGGDLLRLFQNLKASYENATGADAPKACDDALLALLRGGVAPSDVGDVLMRLCEIGVGSQDAADAAVSLTVSRAPPADLEAFVRLCAHIRRGGERWRAPFPSALYSRAVCQAAADLFGHDELGQVFPSANAFDVRLRTLARQFAELGKAAQIPSLAKLEARMQTLPPPKSQQVDEISQRIDEWDTQYTAFAELLGEDAQAALEDSRLGEARRRVAALRDWRDRLAPAIDPAFQRCLVIDTNVLIDRPTVLDELAGDEFAVVPKIVLEELDGKKRDPALASNVRQAVGCLERLPAARKLIAEEDLSLVPADYLVANGRGPSADTRILSVALRYRRCRPIVLTNDRLLRQKAIGEGLQVMALPEFDRRDSAPQSRKGQMQPQRRRP